MPDPGNAVDTLRERISTSDELTDRDRDILLDFSDEHYLRKSQYSDYRHEKLLRHCTIMAEQVGRLAASLEDRNAAESLVR